MGVKGDGGLSFVVEMLQPNTNYYFAIVPNNNVQQVRGQKKKGYRMLPKNLL